MLPAGRDTKFSGTFHKTTEEELFEQSLVRAQTDSLWDGAVEIKAVRTYREDEIKCCG